MELVQSGITAPDIGLAYQFTYVPYAPDFLLTSYTPGALDACGNTVDAGFLYPLDDASGIIAGLGFENQTALLSPYPPYQTVQYTTDQAATGGLAATTNSGADSLSLTFAGFTPIGVGFRINTMPAVGVGEGTMIGLSISQYRAGDTQRTWVLAGLRNDTTDLVVAQRGTTPIYDPGFSFDASVLTLADVQGKNLGVLLNPITGYVSYYVDGQFYTTSIQKNFLAGSAMYLSLFTTDDASTPNAVLEEYEIITQASQLSGFGFPPGTVDFFGNSIDFTPVPTYATWNPADKAATITLSGGDLIATDTSGSPETGVRATVGVSSGRWYWENKITSSTTATMGIATSAADLNNQVGFDTFGHGYISGTGEYITNNTPVAFGASFTTSDVIGFALDMDAGTLEVYKNGVSQGTMVTGLSGIVYPMVSASFSAVTARFGATTFQQNIPEGFLPGLYN